MPGGRGVVDILIVGSEFKGFVQSISDIGACIGWNQSIISMDRKELENFTQ